MNAGPNMELMPAAGDPGAHAAEGAFFNKTPYHDLQQLWYQSRPAAEEGKKKVDYNAQFLKSTMQIRKEMTREEYPLAGPSSMHGWQKALEEQHRRDTIIILSQPKKKLKHPGKPSLRDQQAKVNKFLRESH